MDTQLGEKSKKVWPWCSLDPAFLLEFGQEKHNNSFSNRASIGFRSQPCRLRPLDPFTRHHVPRTTLSTMKMSQTTQFSLFKRRNSSHFALFPAWLVKPVACARSAEENLLPRLPCPLRMFSQATACKSFFELTLCEEMNIGKLQAKLACSFPMVPGLRRRVESALGQRQKTET